MRSFYKAFGLRISADGSVPGLSPVPRPSRVDVTIRFNAKPFPRFHPDSSEFPDEVWYAGQGEPDSTPGLRVWRRPDGAWFRLVYGDDTRFLVDRRGTAVHAAWPAASTLEDTTTYLLGPVLGFVLRLRGVTCLHASAIAVGDRAIALVGPANAGKSTTAAAFSLMGHPVLADDVAALVDAEGGLHVQPAYPQIRLWPDSAALLYGAADALPRLTPTWDKRALDLTHAGRRFEDRPLPLAAVYVLGSRADEGPRVEGLPRRESLLALLANTYVGYLLDPAQRAREFSLLGRLAEAVPVRRVVPPADPSLVPRLCARILDDCEAVACTASPTTAR